MYPSPSSTHQVPGIVQKYFVLPFEKDAATPRGLWWKKLKAIGDLWTPGLQPPLDDHLPAQTKAEASLRL